MSAETMRPDLGHVARYSGLGILDLEWWEAPLVAPADAVSLDEWRARWAPLRAERLPWLPEAPTVRDAGPEALAALARFLWARAAEVRAEALDVVNLDAVVAGSTPEGYPIVERVRLQRVLPWATAESLGAAHDAADVLDRMARGAERLVVELLREGLPTVGAWLEPAP